jgi:hypothetical protein
MKRWRYTMREVTLNELMDEDWLNALTPLSFCILHLYCLMKMVYHLK